jgi:hypothetical protein
MPRRPRHSGSSIADPARQPNDKTFTNAALRGRDALRNAERASRPAARTTLWPVGPAGGRLCAGTPSAPAGYARGNNATAPVRRLSGSGPSAGTDNASRHGLIGPVRSSLCSTGMAAARTPFAAARIGAA